MSGIGLPVDKEWAWGGASGAGLTVAVVDSGIDPAHPAVGRVERAVTLKWDSQAREVISAEGPHEDLFGHGTACAGIIRYAAPDAALWSVRVLGSRLTGKGSVFAAGLRWAISQGARVINLSLSTGREDYFGLFHEIADEAAFAGVVLVCAVNNVPGPTFPNREYLYAATSFGHTGNQVFTNDEPTIMQAMNNANVDWREYATSLPGLEIFAATYIANIDAHQFPITQFYSDAAAGMLGQVNFVDPDLYLLVEYVRDTRFDSVL